MTPEEKRTHRREYMKKWHAANPGYSSQKNKEKRQADLEAARAADREAYLRKKAKWAQLSPEETAARKDRQRKIARRHYDRHSDRKRAQSAAWKHKKEGMIFAPGRSYEEMFAEQDGKCAICGCISERRLDVDHCHKTGHVRALLCNDCNPGIGRLKDDPDRCEAAARYLRTHAQRLKDLSAASLASSSEE
jgi:hypothetical protein